MSKLGVTDTGLVNVHPGSLHPVGYVRRQTEYDHVAEVHRAFISRPKHGPTGAVQASRHFSVPTDAAINEIPMSILPQQKRKTTPSLNAAISAQGGADLTDRVWWTIDLIELSSKSLYRKPFVD